jgi:ethanolamine kinase
MTAPDAAAAAIAAVAARLPAYASLADRGAAVEVVGGGVTNFLLKLTPVDPSLPPVALRTYGDRTELLIDRRAEVKALRRLNALGFGAPLLASFHAGRIEAYLPARPLTPDEAGGGEVAARIAAGAARLHAALRLPSLTRPTLWSTIKRWTALGRRLTAEAGIPPAVDLAAVDAAAARLKAALAPLASPTVFCHMDLLAGNILVAEDGADLGETGPGGGLQFIDFEYGRPAPRGFDLGNHWCEYGGLEGDWGKYPGLEARTAWAAAYLKAAAAATNAPPPTDAAIRALELEGDAYSLAAHIFWTAWAVVQAVVSGVDFDYSSYAASRLAEHQRRAAGVLERLEDACGARVSRAWCC